MQTFVHDKYSFRLDKEYFDVLKINFIFAKKTLS